MTDREKVIYSIERCVSHVPDACRDCSYDNYGEYNACVDKMLRDALELLKEQEPVKPNVRWVKGVSGGTCPKCLDWVQRSYNYCPFCGQAVKWND